MGHHHPSRHDHLGNASVPPYTAHPHTKMSPTVFKSLKLPYMRAGSKGNDTHSTSDAIELPIGAQSIPRRRLHQISRTVTLNFKFEPPPLFRLSNRHRTFH